MIYRVRLFAMLKELAGREAVEVELGEGATVAAVLRGLAEQHPALAPAIDSMPLVMAVDNRYAEPGAEIAAGEELALIPPVSGG